MDNATSIYRPIPDDVLRGLLNFLNKRDDFVFLDTVRVSKENHSSYLFIDPVERLTCRANDDPVAFLERVQTMTAKGFYVAGWTAYEFGYMLEPVLSALAGNDDRIVADLGVYEKAHIYDHFSGRFDTDIPGFVPDPGESPDDEIKISNISFSQAKDDYLQNIARIKSYIEAGDTYQVNYTLKLLFQYSGVDASLYKALRRNQSVAYGAFIGKGRKRIMSFSPELFFRKEGSRCSVRPMKGTMRRAHDLESDIMIRGVLADDEKNRSENVMIVDLLRNDLGRLCKMGSVEVASLFDVETYETLHQMTSSITGELKTGVSLANFFRAVFPCGSVTGAPKIRTMEIIMELETEPRGVYTGGIGFFSPTDDAVFNVPIRTVVLDGDRGEMGIGSGIVYDSDPEREWEECVLKGRFLLEPEPDFQLIETILYDFAKGFWLLDGHLERLQDSVLYWGIPCSLVEIRDELRKAMAVFADEEKCDTPHFRRVRLLLHKDGSVEISSAACDPPAGLVAGESADVSSAQHLPKVCMAGERTDSGNPFLYHKTTRRDLYNRFYKMAGDEGFFECLFLNERDEVTEGCITNIFIRRGEELVTPPLSSGLLNGVFRRALLDGTVLVPGGLVVREELLRLSDLESADEVYLGNSVRGLVRVEFKGDMI